MSDPASPADTRDVLLLAATRPAMIYGVPLQGFVFAAGGAGLVFVLSHNYDVWLRAAACGAAALAALAAMRALTSWEPCWAQIFALYCRTRLLDLFSRHTAAWGGTTFRPWPVAARHDAGELRDYAG